MKQFRSWQWEEDGRTRFYALDLKGKNLVQVWGAAGIMNGTRIMDLEYPNEEGAWATFEVLRAEAEERVGRVSVYPSAKNLFEESSNQLNKVAKAVMAGDHTKPYIDPEDASMELIKTRQLRQKAEEFRQDIELYRKIYQKTPSKKYYRNLMEFHLFLEKGGV